MRPIIVQKQGNIIYVLNAEPHSFCGSLIYFVGQYGEGKSAVKAMTVLERATSARCLKA